VGKEVISLNLKHVIEKFRLQISLKHVIEKFRLQISYLYNLFTWS